MSRMRYIKPAFFTDEDMGALTPIQRLLFIGLWTECDRDGRLEDKPRSLKVKLLPWDDVDISSELQALHSAGRIIRYEVDGSRYIAIPRFLRHQKPHIKEPPSTIPAPASPVFPGPAPASSQPSTGEFPAKNHYNGNGNRNGEVVVRDQLGAGDDDPTEEFELHAVPIKQERKPSEQERFYAWFAGLREQRIGHANSPDHKRNIQWQNKHLADLVSQDKGSMVRAVELYFADESKGQKSPPWSLWLFVQDWPQYFDRAKREVGA